MPVTVITLVLGELLPPVVPAHPAIASTPPRRISKARAFTHIGFANCRRLRTQKPTASETNAILASGANGGNCCLPAGWFMTFAAAATVTVMTVVAPAAPGVTVGGTNVATAPAGKPEADMVTTPVKEVPSGATWIVTFAEPPDATSIGAAGAVSAYEGLITRLNAADVEGAELVLPE